MAHQQISSEKERLSHANPLEGMANKPVEEKLCALMGLWVRYSKELEIVYNLIALTTAVAEQYVTEALSAPESTPAKTKATRRTKTAA